MDSNYFYFRLSKKRNSSQIEQTREKTNKTTLLKAELKEEKKKKRKYFAKSKKLEHELEVEHEDEAVDVLAELEPVKKEVEKIWQFIDLSHSLENNLVTYKGLPPVLICDYLTREKSSKIYEEGTSFHIGEIKFVGNAGTYGKIAFGSGKAFCY